MEIVLKQSWAGQLMRSDDAYGVVLFDSRIPYSTISLKKPHHLNRFKK